jgi:phage repressor protein C with HTH and peptisase S24 domain
MTGDALKNRLKELDISPTKLAESLGITKQNLNSKLGTKEVSITLVKDIAKAVNKNVYEIMEVDIIDLPIQGIPLVSVEAVAGFGNTNFLIKEEDIQAKYVIPDFVGVDFMLRVKGSSMYPKYNSGDVVACRTIRQKTFIQWNKVYVIATKEQGILIKRLHEGKDESSYILVSDNKEYKPFNLPIDEITGIAIVVGVVRLE